MVLLTIGLTFKRTAANVGEAAGKLELLTFTLLVRGKGIHSFIHSEEHFSVCEP